MDSTDVRHDRARLLGAPAFAQDEARLEVAQIEVAEFLDRDRLVIDLLFFGWVFALRDPAQLRLRFLTRPLRRPDAVQTDREATRATALAVLDNVTAFSRCEYAQPKAG